MLNQRDVDFLRDAMYLKVNNLLQTIVDVNNKAIEEETKPKETKKKGETK